MGIGHSRRDETDALTVSTPGRTSDVGLGPTRRAETDARHFSDWASTDACLGTVFAPSLEKARDEQKKSQLSRELSELCM